MPGECWCFRTRRCWNTARVLRRRPVAGSEPASALRRDGSEVGCRRRGGGVLGRIPPFVRPQRRRVRCRRQRRGPRASRRPQRVSLAMGDSGERGCIGAAQRSGSATAAVIEPEAARLPRRYCRRSGVCQAGNGPLTSIRVVVDSHLVGVSRARPAHLRSHAAVLGGIERNEIAYVGDSDHGHRRRERRGATSDPARSVRRSSRSRAPTSPNLDRIAIRHCSTGESLVPVRVGHRHLPRSLPIEQAARRLRGPRELLRAIPGLTFVDVDHVHPIVVLLGRRRRTSSSRGPS